MVMAMATSMVDNYWVYEPAGLHQPTPIATTAMTPYSVVLLRLLTAPIKCDGTDLGTCDGSITNDDYTFQGGAASDRVGQALSSEMLPAAAK